MTLPAGSRLGPYEILSPLGSGGMGEVYRAKDPRLQRDVAIKVLPARLVTDADRLRRFEQEARAAGALNHPNILAVYDFGSHEGEPYVVSELLEGETLRSRLAGGALPTRRAVDFASQITQGLAAAHEKGIVHRDLKPENLFITEDGRLKILDFGLAKLIQPEAAAQQQTSVPTVSPGTEPGVVMGTVGYMSPEQVKGLAADHRSDIFSFGAILYEMLSGRRAFRGDSAVETMSAILKEDPPDLSETNRSLSPGLDRLVRHCLEKTPTQRFQSARDLAYDLEALSGVSGAAAAAPLPSDRSVGRPWMRRLAGALLLAAAIAGAYFTGLHVSVGGASASNVVFSRLTFRRGIITGARLAPDGKTAVYSASWEGQPGDVFLARPDGGESKPFGLPNSRALAVSRADMIAVGLRKENLPRWYVKGTLAEVPLLGGSPRPILEDVTDADWSPDGKDLAVIRLVEGKYLLEFPVGKKLDESPILLYGVRVAPDGRTVIYGRNSADKDELVQVDRAGHKEILAKAFTDSSFAWHPSGREIWLTSTNESGVGSNLRALRLDGSVRNIWSSPDFLTLCDIRADGAILVERRTVRDSLYFRGPGEAADRNLSWLDGSVTSAMSADGQTLLIQEQNDGGGVNGSIFTRRTDGSAAVRVGEGNGTSLSPDGKWVLALLKGKPRLYPSGAGQSRELATGNVVAVYGIFLPPDGARIALVGGEPGHDLRIWIQDLKGGSPKPLALEGPQGFVASPDGKRLAVRLSKEDKIVLFPVDGGERKEVPGTLPDESPIQWSEDGKWLYVVRDAEPQPKHVYRIELPTGRRELWKEIAPDDRAGVFALVRVVMTPDARSYAYSALRAVTSDLYMVEGLK